MFSLNLRYGLQGIFCIFINNLVRIVITDNTYSCQGYYGKGEKPKEERSSKSMFKDIYFVTIVTILIFVAHL